MILSGTCSCALLDETSRFHDAARLAGASPVYVRTHLLGPGERALFDSVTKDAGVGFQPIGAAAHQ
jgi:hypothetical protein